MNDSDQKEFAKFLEEYDVHFPEHELYPNATHWGDGDKGVSVMLQETISQNAKTAIDKEKIRVLKNSRKVINTKGLIDSTDVC